MRSLPAGHWSETRSSPSVPDRAQCVSAMVWRAWWPGAQRELQSCLWCWGL